MSLSPRTRLGTYEILSPIGAGGMGEVYRARDTKLGRDVALKILPDAFASDADRLARFKREAQVLASINHPNIAQIYGVEDSGATHALVLELVDGPTLADRIAEGPIPLAEALPIARQIAEALESAHELGIVHRDLKPANVKVRDDGTVKVLDFGLAKAVDPVSTITPADMANSPTITARSTQMGIIVGTAAYMAPEQARGRVVDRRADIWAFGAVLFEMITGRRAFEGEDVSITLANVLKEDVSWNVLPESVPPAVRHLLRRCLDKDPKRRLQAIGEARVEIEDLLSGRAASTPESSPTRVPRRRSWLFAAAALLIGAGLTAAIVSYFDHRAGVSRPAGVMRFAFDPSPTQRLPLIQFDHVLAISPKGTHIVVQVAAADRPFMLRAIDQLDVIPLPGTESGRSPFFSPDGKWIGYFGGSSGRFWKVPLGGGPPLVIGSSVGGGPRGAAWLADDTIVFATNDGRFGLSRLPAGGGDPTTLTMPDTAKGEIDHWFPSALPGNRAVLFTIVSNRAGGRAQVAVLDLQTKKYRALFAGSQPTYMAPPDGAGPGYVLYGLDGSLRAVRFDLSRLEAIGDPILVLDKVTSVNTGATEFTVSETGTLAFMPGTLIEGNNTLAWFDRKGTSTAIAGAPPRAYYTLRLSPDNHRIALDIRDRDSDVWMLELERQTLTRLTSGSQTDGFPVWSRDGTRLAMASEISGPYQVFVQRPDATGDAEQLTRDLPGRVPMSFGPDGTLVLQELGNQRPGLAVLKPGAKDPAALFKQPFSFRNGEISPDGRWLAYESDESGRFDVYVRPFPDVDAGRWPISTAGGTKPAWRPDGRELFFVDSQSKLYAVPIGAGPGFQPGKPEALFDAPNPNSLVYGRHYDVARDGRFVLIRQAEASTAPSSVVVVLNWYDELKAKMERK
jgi:serine/threonine-protein kinase